MTSSGITEDPFSEVMVLFLHNLHRSGPGCFFVTCCEQGETFARLNLRMLHRNVFVPQYSPAGMLLVECLFSVPVLKELQLCLELCLELSCK